MDGHDALCWFIMRFDLNTLSKYGLSSKVYQQQCIHQFKIYWKFVELLGKVSETTHGSWPNSPTGTEQASESSAANTRCCGRANWHDLRLFMVLSFLVLLMVMCCKSAYRLNGCIFLIVLCVSCSSTAKFWYFFFNFTNFKCSSFSNIDMCFLKFNMYVYNLAQTYIFFYLKRALSKI